MCPDIIVHLSLFGGVAQTTDPTSAQFSRAATGSASAEARPAPPSSNDLRLEGTIRRGTFFRCRSTASSDPKPTHQKNLVNSQSGFSRRSGRVPRVCAEKLPLLAGGPALLASGRRQPPSSRKSNRRHGPAQTRRAAPAQSIVRTPLLLPTRWPTRKQQNARRGEIRRRSRTHRPAHANPCPSASSVVHPHHGCPSLWHGPPRYGTVSRPCHRRDRQVSKNRR